jgi:hypothetical protein
MAMDTRDGIIRQLVSNQPNGHMINATLTWDGNRVVFFNHSSNQVLIANWDGTGCKTVLNNCRSERCWRSADGKVSLDYEVLRILPNRVDSLGVLRLSVARELLEPLRPARLRVEGSAAGSQRWFLLFE